MDEENNHSTAQSQGRWTDEEHHLFLAGMKEHSKDWFKVSEFVKYRSVVQVRSHAQKFFLRKNSKKKEQPIPDIASSEFEGYYQAWSYHSVCSSQYINLILTCLAR